jgi:hypothetical protein
MTNENINIKSDQNMNKSNNNSRTSSNNSSPSKSSSASPRNLLSNINNNKENSNNNSNLTIISTETTVSEASCCDIGMKTVRINNNESNSKYIPPVIDDLVSSSSDNNCSMSQFQGTAPFETTCNNSVVNDDTSASGNTAAIFTNPQSNTTEIYISHSPNSATNEYKPRQVSPNSPKKSDQSQEQSTTTTTTTTTTTNGIVRRLSVTARPGDIFYKVKDVTESASTTDNNNIDKPSSTPPPPPASSNKSSFKAIASNGNRSQIPTVSPKKESPNDPKSSQQSKKTSWNVKRNQNNTHLQIDNTPETTIRREDDSLIDNNNDVSNIEPGSPMFAKELLSIR